MSGQFLMKESGFHKPECSQCALDIIRKVFNLNCAIILSTYGRGELPALSQKIEKTAVMCHRTRRQKNQKLFLNKFVYFSHRRQKKILSTKQIFNKLRRGVSGEMAPKTTIFC